MFGFYKGLNGVFHLNLGHILCYQYVSYMTKISSESCRSCFWVVKIGDHPILSESCAIPEKDEGVESPCFYY